MCDYCGCRDLPLIGQLSAEHESISDAVIALPIPAWDHITPTTGNAR